MPIKFHNTLSGAKEDFVPIDEGKVRMYTCGPTTYDFAHIGNFRAYIFQDILRRWLTHRGYRVTHIMNITDVDDKTIHGSSAEGLHLREFTDRYVTAFFEDLESLRVEKAEYYPRATDHIEEMIKLTQKLMDKNLGYRGEDGTIYFSVHRFSQYGKLSRVDLKGLKVGARVKSDEYTKENPQDFALWKAWDAKDGDVFWQTPLGKGRPGWHLECSAMSMKYLGETFDIHSGGVDLIFPHHENEIAQSQGSAGVKFVNYWLHCEHLLVDGKKMSKSLGNFYTLKDILAMGYKPEAVRYVLLATHYKQQLNFTFDALEAGQNTVERFRQFVDRLQEITKELEDSYVMQLTKSARVRFEEAMDDDLNITLALSSMFEYIREMNRLIDQSTVGCNAAAEAAQLMSDIDQILAIGKVEVVEPLAEEMVQLIEMREQARAAGDWETADQIRAKLKQQGIILEDTPQGIRWKKMS